MPRLNPFDCADYWRGYEPPKPPKAIDGDKTEITVVVSDGFTTLGIPTTVIGENSPTGLPAGTRIADKLNGGCEALQAPQSKILLDYGFFHLMAMDETTPGTACATACRYIWTPHIGIQNLLMAAAQGLVRILYSSGIFFGEIERIKDLS